MGLKEGCALQVEKFEELVKQYLASIPAISEPEPISLVEITPLPGSFPDDVVTENIRWGLTYHPVQWC